MAFSDEALKAKLSTLNETQDSIVSVSQWIMFHKRHADRIANYWLTRLRDSPPPKRLNYVYLVNDIVQNARARKRAEFPDAFSPLMPEAMQTAYRSSTPEIQGKLRRVLEVWKTRNVFEGPIQEAIEARLDEVDKSKGASSTGTKKTLMGNSLFNSTGGTGTPKELETLAPLQIAVTKAIISARPSIDTAQTEYTKLNDPTVSLPSPPVYAARLSSLIKALTTAESSVSASIKARQSLITDLEKILEINKSALAKDEETFLDLSSRKTSTEAKKREVEDAIIRGLTSTDTTDQQSWQQQEGDILGFDGNGLSDQQESENNGGLARSGSTTNFERPEVEELTPEPDDFFPSETSLNPTASSAYQPQQSNNPAVAALLAGFGSSDQALTNSASSNNVGMKNRRSSGHGLNGLSAKRRKLSHGDDSIVPDLGDLDTDLGGGDSSGNVLEDLDADVSELLRQEGAFS